MYNKFLDYVKRYLENDVLRRVKNFCRSCAANIIYNDPYYSCYSKIEYFGINDLNIITCKAWEYNKLPEGICFEVIVNPEIIFYADFSGQYDMESDSYNKLWLRVQYIAQLRNENLENIKFNGVDIYDSRKSKHSLDGSLVPYISKSDYDKVASKVFLSEFNKIFTAYGLLEALTPDNYW